jgi:aldehyde:ferredoxin oxidoreductase
MGSKNLKAVVVTGSKKITPAADEFLKAMTQEVIKGIQEDPFAGFFTKWGTAFSMDMGWAAGDVPVKNWQVGYWPEGCTKLGGARMADTILKPHAGLCYNCPIRCARWVHIKEGRFAYEGPGPEYETLGAFGSMLLIDDLEAVAWIGEMCNRYGLDTISAGCTVAWAMEAYEKGALTRDDTGGIDLTWGNVDAVLQVVEQMGRMEGLGALLAQGSRKASQTVGKGSEEYAIQVKGLEVPMHDPRCYFSLAVNYATGTRGACHVQGGSYVYELALVVPEAGIIHRQGRHDRRNKGLAAKVAQDLSAVYNSTAICMFAGMALQPSHYGILLSITTGMPHNAQSVLQAGERIINLQRAFACREGITRKDDVLPRRLLTPLPDGGSAGKAPDLETQLSEYYPLRGWDEEGIPTKEKLEALGLEEAAKDLHGG